MHVSALLGNLDINCFSDILGPYRTLNPDLKICVDGGAGLGETAEKIFKNLPQDDVKVLAFEPNPNNIAEFKFSDPRLTIVDAALGARRATARFHVAATTQRQSETNPYLVPGTSFVGKLVDEAASFDKGDQYEVQVVRMDDSLRENGCSGAQFIKLDLLGGELDALKGLGDMLGDVHWMWIEYGGQPELLELLIERGFVLFDTQYLFFGDMKPEVKEAFTVTRKGKNSVGREIFFGRRKQVWRNYASQFSYCRKSLGMVQTDLVAVAPAYISSFLDACYLKGKLGAQGAIVS